MPSIILAINDGTTPPSLLAVDPQSGAQAMIPVAAQGRLTGTLALDDSRVLAGVFEETTHRTTVVGVSLDSRAVTALGALPGDAKMQTLTPEGTAVVGLHLVAFRPAAVIRLALPADWQGATAPYAGTRPVVWLGRAAAAPQPEPLVIARSAPTDDQQLTWQTTAVTLSPYISLLLDRQQEQIYAIDYYQQTVTHVRVASGRSLQSVRFGTIPTKRPSCAAMLAPAGETLYFLANRSANEGAGLLVYETPSLRQLAHWFATETQFDCLGQSTDGRWMYLLTDPGELRVVDPRSGALLHTIPLDRSALGLRFVEAHNSVNP